MSSSFRGKSLPYYRCVQGTELYAASARNHTITSLEVKQLEITQSILSEYEQYIQIKGIPLKVVPPEESIEQKKKEQ